MRSRRIPTPQNTSPPDDAPPAPKSIVPAPAKTPKSISRPHSPPASAAQTISSDLPGLGTPDTQTNTSIRDTSDEINRESPERPRPQSPTLPASFYDAAPPVPPPSPRSTHAHTNILYTPRLQTTSASL